MRDLHFRSLTRKRKIVLFVSGLAGTLIAGYFSGISYSIYRPIPFDEPALNRAVQWVGANENPPRLGAVTLPPQLASVSVTGKAYVSGGMIFFPSWRGRKTLLPDPLNSDADNIEGYGFSAKTLPTEESEPDSSTSFFCLLDFSDPPHSAATGDTGPEMAVSRCLKPYWYEIDSFS